MSQADPKAALSILESRVELQEELELEEAAPAETAAVEKQRAEEPRRQLVKVYLLSMRLPSKYLVQEVKIVENGQGWQEVRDFQGLRAAIASRLEGIRREAYERIQRVFAYVEEYGTWIAVTDDAVREARELSAWIMEELKKIAALAKLKDVERLLKRYQVKAVPVYLEPEDARELLQAAIRHLSADVDELRRKIEEAERERKKSALKKYQQRLEYREALLRALKQYLAKIG